MLLGLQRRVARPDVLLRLQVILSARYRRLSCIVIGGTPAFRAGLMGRRDRLPRIAHFLHGSAGATREASNTNKYSN